MNIAKKRLLPAGAFVLSLLLVFGLMVIPVNADYAEADSSDQDQKSSTQLSGTNESEDEGLIEDDKDVLEEESNDLDQTKPQEGYQPEQGIAATSAETNFAEETEGEIVTYDDAAAVTTEAEFIAAIEDADIDVVTMGANIEITRHITIPSSKTNLTIDGNDFTLSQRAGSNYLDSAAGSNTSYTFRNMTFTGRSYFGIVSCSNNPGPTVHVENVSYTGPQMIYAPHSTFTFSGTNDIVITAANGGNPAQEFAEVHALEIAGTFTMSSTSTTDSMIWLHHNSGTMPYIFVEENATATISSTVAKPKERGVFWIEGGSSYHADLTVASGASLTIDVTGWNALSPNSTHRLGTIDVQDNATLDIRSAGGIMVANQFNIGRNSDVRLVYETEPNAVTARHDYPLMWFTSSASSPALTVNNPRVAYFAVEPSDQPLFRFDAVGSMQCNTTDVNYWSSSSDAASKTRPTGMWWSDDPGDFNATFSMGTSVQGDNQTSLTSSDSDFESSFNIAEAQVFQVGTNPFAISADRQWDYEESANGVTDANASVFVDYQSDGGVYTDSGTSDASGSYNISLTNTPLDAYSDFLSVAVIPFIAVHDQDEVLSGSDPAADPVTTLVPVDTSLTDDGLELLTNIESNASGDVHAEITNYDAIDTSTVGPYTAEVEITNNAGKMITIDVPVFVYDEYTLIDESANYALRAHDFMLNVEVYVTSFTMTLLSNYSAWNIVTGDDISGDVQVTLGGIKALPGSYEIGLALNTGSNSLETSLVATLYSTTDWINVRVPTTMLFGTLDSYENGTIISPEYEMQNLANQPVAVSLSALDEHNSDGVKLLESGSGTQGNKEVQLTLNIDADPVIEYLTPFVSEQSYQYALPLMTLDAFGGVDDVRTITFSGTYYGDFGDDVARPSYTLVWQFGTPS